MTPRPHVSAWSFYGASATSGSFDTPEALRAQILKDVRTAHAYFRRLAAWAGRTCTSC